VRETPLVELTRNTSILDLESLKRRVAPPHHGAQAQQAADCVRNRQDTACFPPNQKTTCCLEILELAAPSRLPLQTQIAFAFTSCGLHISSQLHTYGESSV